ncbi:MAG TPA: CsiV family protein [Steroidobacteraceae bacterium]|nr:CsiV family protein [Steroidobacteraceae bacterium]
MPTTDRYRAIAAALGAAALLCATLAGDVSGATPSPDTFNVELVIFRYNGTVASPEFWDVAPQAAPVNADVPTTPADAAVPADSFRPLNPAQFQLAGTEAALRRNAGYEPLAHFGIRVTVPERDAGTAIAIDSLVDASSGISGSITLQRGRFLHLELDLLYTTADPLPKLLQPNLPAGPMTFRLHQDRRMRPFERHYFDHPAFGVVAIITTVGGSSD